MSSLFAVGGGEKLGLLAAPAAADHRLWSGCSIGDVQHGLDSLQPHLEPEAIPNAQAPVRACHRYLTNRGGQLDYPAALEAGLPIGSGEVESAHRYVIQNRLKIVGAWWKEEHAQDMLALRVCLANQDWEAYWSQMAQQVA